MLTAKTDAAITAFFLRHLGNTSKTWPSAYGCVTQTGNQRGELAREDKQVCHASINSWGKDLCSQVLAIFNAVFVTVALRPIAEQYWAFILDPTRSPWRAALKDIKIVKHEDNTIGFILQDILDVNCSLLVNLMIACRVPLEHPGMLKLWHKLVKAGYTEVQALYVISQFQIGEGAKIIQEVQRGHNPFDDNTSWSRLSNADPRLDPKKTFRLGTGYLPCNAVWHGLADVDTSMFQQMQKYTGSFKSNPWTYPSVIIQDHGQNAKYFNKGLPALPEFMSILEENKAKFFS